MIRSVFYNGQLDAHVNSVSLLEGNSCKVARNIKILTDLSRVRLQECSFTFYVGRINGFETMYSHIGLRGLITVQLIC